MESNERVRLPQFKAAMQEKIEDNQTNRNWGVVLCSTIPKSAQIVHEKKETYQYKGGIQVEG
jgi:hypothetical protein